MKRFTTIIALVGFAAVSLFTTGLFADETTTHIWHPAYVDADGDGECDAPLGYSFDGKKLFTAYVNENIIDSDGDGICDYDGVRYNPADTTNVTNHLDANGDGICDYCAYRIDSGQTKGTEKGAGAKNGKTAGNCNSVEKLTEGGHK